MEIKGVYELFNAPLVSISDAQRRPVPHLNWIRTVHIGIPETQLMPQQVSQRYLAFIGHFSSESGANKAIRIAGEAGMKLMVAAQLDDANRQYYETNVAPLISRSPHVEFVGAINDRQKPTFLSGAHALLFPTNRPDPFDIAIIEAMACGTPVIAFNCGSIPEVIDDGVTGFIVHDEVTAVAAVSRLGELDRTLVRARFERRFTARRMADDYLDLYKELCVIKRPHFKHRS